MLARTTRFIGGAAFLLAATAAAAVPAAAQTWNAASDWSTTNNPGTAWMYGYATTAGGSVTPFANYYPAGRCNGDDSNIDCWHSQPNSTPNDSYLGDTEHNHIGVADPLPDSDLVLRGIGTTGYSVVQWTAPTTGTFDVTGFFAQGSTFGGEDSPPSVDVFENGGSTPIFTAVANGSETQQTFSFLDLALASGSTLDFATDTPSSYGGYTTGERLYANIAMESGTPTTTPEPSSLALLGTGLIGLVPMVRRRVARGR